jgi:transcriptional regulator with XRE-family HTH domain
MSVFKYGKDVPDFVKRFRREREMTQLELANLMGVHAQYVSNVERRVHKSYVSFGSLLLPLVGRERKPYLIDLIGEASSQRAVERLQTKAKVYRRPKSG